MIDDLKEKAEGKEEYKNQAIEKNMSKKLNSEILIPSERIAARIMFMREEKIMLDFHLAELYGIETRALKQAVKRNIERFPSDFMFELSKDEINSLVSQNVIPSKGQLGGAVPYAFTEPGVAMLSSILKTKTAVNVNIAIMRTFVKLRKMMFNYKEVLKWQTDTDRKLGEHDDKLLLIFEYLKQFEETKIQESEQKNRPKIGFKQGK
jgi:hypothetical protein